MSQSVSGGTFASGLPIISANDHLGGQLLAQHLIDAGHYILAEAGPLVGELARRLVEREKAR